MTCSTKNGETIFAGRTYVFCSPLFMQLRIAQLVDALIGICKARVQFLFKFEPNRAFFSVIVLIAANLQRFFLNFNPIGS